MLRHLLGTVLLGSVKFLVPIKKAWTSSLGRLYLLLDVNYAYESKRIHLVGQWCPFVIYSW